MQAPARNTRAASSPTSIGFSPDLWLPRLCPVPAAPVSSCAHMRVAHAVAHTHAQSQHVSRTRCTRLVVHAVAHAFAHAVGAPSQSNAPAPVRRHRGRSLSLSPRVLVLAHVAPPRTRALASVLSLLSSHSMRSTPHCSRCTSTLLFPLAASSSSSSSSSSSATATWTHPVPATEDRDIQQLLDGVRKTERQRYGETQRHIYIQREVTENMLQLGRGVVCARADRGVDRWLFWLKL